MTGRLEDAAALKNDLGTVRNDALKPLVFSTETMPLRAQFDAWHDRCAPMIDVAREGMSSRPFVARNELWNLHGMLLSVVSAPASDFRRSQRVINRDGIDHWVIGCAVRGGIRFSAGEQRQDIAQGVPFVWTMSQAFEGAREDSEWVTLFLPRDNFADLAPLLDAAVETGAETPLSGLLADYMISLAARVTELGADDLAPLAGATRAMIGACLAPLRDAAPMSEAARDLVLSERVRRAVSANLGSVTLGPGRLCRILGVSRSQLYRTMERYGGVARYIQRQRLIAAHKALSNPEDVRPIQAVAEAIGFADASTFGRAFRQTFGTTPGEVRAAARVGTPLEMLHLDRGGKGVMGFPELVGRL